MERRTENRLRQRNRMRNHWCPAKRLAAFILSFAMLVVNIGNSAAVAMAAEGNSRHVEFQMNQEDIWTAAKEAVSAGIGISAESFNFAQGDLEGIGELFAGGQLFEITNEVKYMLILIPKERNCGYLSVFPEMEIREATGLPVRKS